MQRKVFMEKSIHFSTVLKGITLILTFKFGDWEGDQ